MVEQFANNATSTLNSGINASVTSITLVDGSPFSSTGTFRIIIDSEILLVTARSGNNLTVTRGQEGTIAVSHSSGASVVQILTASAMSQLKLDLWPIIWTATQTANYSIQAADQGIAIDSTTTPITVTLPASPSDGERHMIADVAGKANTNAISVAGNGHTIVGLSTYIMTGQYNVLEIAYHAGKGVWMII